MDGMIAGVGIAEEPRKSMWPRMHTNSHECVAQGCGRSEMGYAARGEKTSFNGIEMPSAVSAPSGATSMKRSPRR